MTTNGTSATATRLIAATLAVAGPQAELIGAHEREWASATFSGARHRIELRLWLDGPDARLAPALLALPDHEFELPREIVADCTIAFGAREAMNDGRILQPVAVELLTITAD